MEAWYTATLLGWSVPLLLWQFVVYSFLGVVIETIFCLVREGILESRLGLLYLPLRPMYGVGGVASTLLLDRFHQQPIVVFLGGMLVCSVVEYTAGTICEKAFGTISWDYRGKLLHLHGRICLQYSCYWGLLAGLAVYVFNPWISRSVSRLDPETGESVLAVLIALAIASAVLTVAAWSRTRQRLGVLRARAEGRAVAIRATVVGRLIDGLAPDLLMINTFPRTPLAQELMTLTGQQRSWIRWPRYGVFPEPAGPSVETPSPTPDHAQAGFQPGQAGCDAPHCRATPVVRPT